MTRLLAPVGVLALLAAVATVVLSPGDDRVPLPDTTPDALVAALRGSGATGFSGIVVSHFSLGVPIVPGDDEASTEEAGPDLSAPDDASMLALLDGAHTMQVWYGGVDQQRVAVLGATDETDLFRNGRDLWRWNSARRVAVHLQLPVGNRPLLSSAVPRAADATSLTPSGLAGSVLAALDGKTKVEIAPGVEVADRPAYNLVLTPQERSTRIGSVHIAVDGATKIPLAVQVYARGAEQPAVDVGFTSIRLGRPPAAYFHFAPPVGATVRQAGATTSPPITILGSGWTSVLSAPSVGPLELNRFVTQEMSRVSGTWGTGRVLHTDLVTVLLTDDQRLFVGAVDPDELYTAAGNR
jgi:outer membrane lipoprotein-sorting protein